MEATAGLPMGKDKEEGWRSKYYATHPWVLPAPASQLQRSVPFLIEADELLDLFGPDLAAKARGGKDAGRVKGNAVSLPASMEEDWPKIMEVMKELLGAPDGSKKKDEPRMSISEKDAELLLKIAKSPLRAQIMARLKKHGGGEKGASLGQVLEIAIEEQEMQDARKRLGERTPGTGGGEEPVVKRPVHGDIVLTGGRPVSSKETVFTWQAKDEVDAFRAPFIEVRWFAYPQGHPDQILEWEVNKYSPLRSTGPVNDKFFEVTFLKAGTYVIEALVHHNFFMPAHFKTEVKILTEQAEVDFQEKGAMAGFTAPTGAKTTKHDFDVGGFTGAVTDYEEGTVTRGQLDPAFKSGTLEDRLKGIDGEIKRVDAVFKSYEKRQGEQAASVRNWAEDYLKTLREGRAKVAAEGKDGTLVPCTGVYVSRSKKAPSASLDLVCLQKRLPNGNYHVSLHDLSQVYEPENYFFEVENATGEGAYEEVFVEAAESYPDGTLSVAFQGWDEKKQAPTSSYVKFRKVTDTVGKDIKTNVFDPAINIAVNVAAAVMMVVPGLQGAGFALAIIWNTSQTIAELEEKSAKGTLKDKDVAYAAASFALDLIPLVGRSSKMISLGRKAFYVIEGVQIAGQALLLTAKGIDDIEKLRNGVISKLGRLTERIEELERVNPSDPELELLRSQQEKLVKEGEDATIEVFSGLVAEQGLMLVGGALIQHAAIKKFGARVGEMETKGKFAHKPGEKLRYDYDQKSMVGDRDTMTQAQFDTVERHAGLSENLEKAVPDGGTRKKIVDTIADAPVDVVVGGKKTRLETEGDRQVLRVAEGAKPDEVLSEALRAKTGKVATPETPGQARDPAQKAAAHRNELEHLEELRKLTAAEPGLDDFKLARKIRGQFIEMEATVGKLPAGKERAELEGFLKRYKTKVYEPATRVVDRISKAGGPKALNHFETLKPDQRAFVGALEEDGMKGFFNLSREKQNKLLGMSKETLDQIRAHPGPKQRQLISDVDNLARAAAQDVNYNVTNAAGVTRAKEGHPFDEHGAHNTDATMFGRAVAETNPKGRWASAEAQVREIEHFRKRLLDPAVPAGDLHSPINAAGRNAIQAGHVTREQILADPVANDQYLKADVTFRAEPSSNNSAVGDSFRPDGTTKIAGVKKVTVVFQLDDAGNWQVLTGFPVE